MLGETFGRSYLLRRSSQAKQVDGEEPRMAVLVVAVTTFAVIFLAELPDKSAMASLVLGIRYPAVPALTGTVAAFTVHVVLAVVAGSLLALLPRLTLGIVVAVAFLAGGLFLLFGHSHAVAEGPAEQGRGSQKFWPAAAAAFVVILLAEFGDLTQIVIANLTARYHNPLAVGIAADLAMSTVAAIAIFGGKGLLRLVPVTLVTRLAATLMVGLAGFSLASALG
ncbi:MAG TPA: TMEM165/GDT1 family protein [Streptosporangiaceae bacterium]|nr:TMEM165/GDT1 family protein [Streptosporangiaceae bacterium]